MTQPRFSVIIPAYNEEVLLPRLLDSVDRARDRYAGGRDRVEIIVADNASTDRTAAIAAARECRVVSVAKRMIAAARNAGAWAARGTILCFSDADAQVHPDTFTEVDRVLTDDVIGGVTSARFERDSFALRVSFWFLVAIGVLLCGLRSRQDLDIDTGVVFVRRADFVAMGGYRESGLFAEDVHLLLDLRRFGRRRGQRVIRGTRAPATMSTRKFDRYGDWHYFTRPLPMFWHYFVLRDDRTVRDYWYGGR